MKTTPHTPGPWKTGNKYPTRIIGGRTCIAATALPDDETFPSNEQIANARLIAAAPQMLAALRVALGAIGDSYDATDADGEEGAALWDQVADAIEAATGKTADY